MLLVTLFNQFGNLASVRLMTISILGPALVVFWVRNLTANAEVLLRAMDEQGAQHSGASKSIGLALDAEPWPATEL